MADPLPEFDSAEPKDTKFYSGTVTTSAIQIPSSPLGEIVKIEIECSKINPTSRQLGFSWDGISYKWLDPSEIHTWEPGQKQQVWIKASVSTVEYEITINIDRAE